MNQLNQGATAAGGAASACDATLDPIAATLVDYTADFVCLRDGDGELCAPQVAAALQTAGLLPLLQAPASWVPASANATAVCAALSGAGCCGKTFAMALVQARPAITRSKTLSALRPP